VAVATVRFAARRIFQHGPQAGLERRQVGRFQDRSKPALERFEIAPGTPAYRFSFLPLQAAPTPAPDRPHTRLFELRRARRPDAGGRP